jgi:Icc-related predicted phosphoesterase
VATWFFVSDLHGHSDRYARLFAAVRAERPRAVLLGGDLLPTHLPFAGDFTADVLLAGLAGLRAELGPAAPRVLLILGNDDGRAEEARLEATGELLEYLHGRWVDVDGVPVLGYSYVPPTPFMLKDWERYDVSRYVDPGCVAPEEGYRTVAVDPGVEAHATIARDLERLADGRGLDRAVLLLHTPPYRCALDRAGLDGQMVDHVPVDVHVGSIAVQRFIADRQPMLTLHGHVHEAPRITGTWRERFGRTHAFTAAHDGPELALVRFDPDDLEAATRELV